MELNNLLSCFVCKFTFNSVRDLVRHLKLAHAFYPGNKFQLICDQNGCSQRFSTFSGFRKHLNKIHRASNVGHCDTTSSSFCPDQQIEPSCYAVEVQPESLTSSERTRQSTREMCASLIGKLLSCGVANTVVKSVVDNLEELVDEVHTNIKDDVLNLLPENENVKSKLEDYFEGLDNPFTNVNTETKLKRYYGEKWGLVEPVEIALGVRYDSRRNRTSGTNLCISPYWRP